jgi:hypothetical protein
MRKIFSTLLLSVFLLGSTFAKEGMWIPSLIGLYNLDDMQAMGLKLNAEDIFSLEQESLKDVIVHFGGGCTAEVISENGLILTNHHCGYRQIQFHSSLENDYLKDGFWANSLSEELVNPGLKATFVISISEVTEQIIGGLSKDISEEQRQVIVNAKIDSLEKKLAENNSYKAKIKPFYYGNQYFAFLTEEFKDVRLVGAPPSNIGKFGKDTDNWMWPRHTGDFAIFRIYANSENEPAEYSEENVPYKPRKSLTIYGGNRQENDFTMVYGFPGLTETYLSSESADFVVNQVNPFRLKMREASLSVIDAAMRSSDLLRIKYASKQSSISNAYKKWIGQNQGLKEIDAINLKKDFETEFENRVNDNPDYANYKNVLANLSAANKDFEPYQFARACLIEYFYYGPELLGFANSKRKLSNFDYLKSLTEKEKESLIKEIELFYKDFDLDVEMGIFKRQTPIYFEYHDKSLMAPELINSFESRFNLNIEKYTDFLYGKKALLNEKDFLIDLVSNPSKNKAKKLAKDPMYQLSINIYDTYMNQVRASYAKYKTIFDGAMREFSAAQMDVFENEKVFWPDANSTLRVTYGKVEGSSPRDGMEYRHYTTAKGILQKYLTGNPDYEVNDRLKQLIEKKKYYPYQQDDDLWVCFTGSNHTTGGNSGSPVLNANGQLIGLNFDRSWESTMSDIMFNPDRCRNIAVDIRYILFIVDRYANCKHIMSELKIVGLNDFKKVPEAEASRKL